MLPAADTLAALEALLAALDYTALGDIYCDAGGVEFWRDRRPAVLACGRRWAAELARRLPRGGRSLYVGAGVAELAALLTEVLDLGRQCTATNLRAAECEVLNAGLARVGLSDRLRFAAVDAATVAAPRRFDHAALVCVLDDPETYPQVSEVTYGRASPLALDLDAFARERQQIRALADALLGALSLPAWITTTLEEVPWLAEAADRAGLRLRGDDVVVETPLVGDGCGFLAVEAVETVEARR